jgi:hypothetical protein
LVFGALLLLPQKTCVQAILKILDHYQAAAVGENKDSS